MNPKEPLNGLWSIAFVADAIDRFTFECAEMVNKLATDRVATWQSLKSLLGGHSSSLMDIGKASQAGEQELQAEEEALKAAFPTTIRIMEADEEAISSIDNEGNAENGHKSESSGVLIEKDEYASDGNVKKCVNIAETTEPSDTIVCISTLQIPAANEKLKDNAILSSGS